mmetsp:Transcript_49694/g.119688  ORF Transcript_49694/g.119688 Transcript_49694/m.119688 type:complete len:244 (-) Transcript_49694:148-879(-)
MPSEGAQPRLGAAQGDQPLARHRDALLLLLLALHPLAQETEHLPRQRARAHPPLRRRVEGPVLGEEPEVRQAERGLARALALLEEERLSRRPPSQVELRLRSLVALHLLRELHSGDKRGDLVRLLAARDVPRAQGGGLQHADARELRAVEHLAERLDGGSDLQRSSDGGGGGSCRWRRGCGGGLVERRGFELDLLASEAQDLRLQGRALGLEGRLVGGELLGLSIDRLVRHIQPRQRSPEPHG